MPTVIRRHPLGASLVISLVWVLIVTFGALLLRVTFPTLPGYGSGLSQSLVLVLVGVVVVAAVLTGLGWWRRAGFVTPSHWRDLGVLLLPALLLLFPLAGGIRSLPMDTIGILIVAYLATAFVEESLYRGLTLGILRPSGVGRAVLISSVLFGLVHLSNTLLRGASMVIVAQAFGAACGGVALAALRIRTNTIWPLILLHALGDLFLQFGTLPIPLVEAVRDTILLAYGVFILRPSRTATLTSPAVDRATV